MFILGLAIAAFIGAAWVESLKPSPACQAELPVTGSYSPSCWAAFDAWQTTRPLLGGLLQTLLVLVPLAAGLFLGVPIIAREIERGTTRLAWSIAPSRMRWYLARLLPVLVVLFAVALAAGAAADRLLVVTEGADPARSFGQFGYRGVLLALRAVLIFSIAVVVGAVLARSFPSIIVASVIGAVAISGGQEIHHRILVSEAVPAVTDGIGEDLYDAITQGDMYIDTLFRLPDGSIVGWEYFVQEEPYDEQGNPRYPMVVMVIPADRYREVEAREALALGGASLAALLVTALVVNRRRPD